MFYYENRIDVSLDCGTEMITKQCFKDECDINNIMNQYKRTGIITHIIDQQPIYADLPDVVDYQTSLNHLQEAQEAFDSLPSVVRRYFDNDPAALLAAIGDPEQHDKLVELGIINPPARPQPPGNPTNPTVPLDGPPTLP